MPDFLQLVATLREHMQAELTRTDALRPLVWPIAGLLLALTASYVWSAPFEIKIGLGALLALLVISYVVAYGYFAVTDSDALRSEKYKLEKMAIEQGLYGNSTTGLQKMADMSGATKLIEASPKGESPHD